ncbi:MAG: hypothetical protein HY547_00805 [Elusimicrobia bacterium]|nr:hypothetical protein [Elusimicrobiota bacterium]
MGKDWIKQLENLIDQTYQLLEGINASHPNVWISQPLELLQDAKARIDSIRASASQLNGLDSRRRDGASLQRDSSEIQRPRKLERNIQINALRIAIIDLNEICENLSQAYWVSLLGLTSIDEKSLFLDRFSKSRSIKNALRAASSSLVDGGTTHLDKLRDALAHSFMRYSSRIIPEGNTIPEPAKFHFESAGQNPKNWYHDEIFDPLCQMGERKNGNSGNNDLDFSRVQHHGLNAAFFSAGRVAVDCADALHKKICELSGHPQSRQQAQATPVVT